MGLFTREIYAYNLFERVKINLDKEQQKPNVIIEKVYDNDKYIFYEYATGRYSTRYIIGQLKNNPKMIYFLGNAATYMCEFKDNLFLCDECAEMGRDESLIRRVDLNNKTEEFYNLRGDYSKMLWFNGYGRCFSTDNYMDMKVVNDELVIYGHREKGDAGDTDDVFNCEMDFEIIFRFENNQFVPYFKPSQEDCSKSKTKRNEIVKEFTNKMIDFVEANNLEDLSKSDCEFYANVFNCIYELTGKKFTFDEILNIYDFFTDVLDGNRPNVDIIVEQDAFKGLYRLSKRYSLTKNLEESERLYMCFCIFQAKCIMKFNEETEELQFNRELFEGGPNAIIDEFEYSLKEFPERFTIKVLSDPTKEDYGFTIDNPIEVTGVAVEYQYLKGITYHGEDITFEHSFDYKGKYDNWVDSFDIFVDGEKITTLYFTSDGSYNSITCPKGFEFKK